MDGVGGLCERELVDDDTVSRGRGVEGPRVSSLVDGEKPLSSARAAGQELQRKRAEGLPWHGRRVHVVLLHSAEDGRGKKQQ